MESTFLSLSKVRNVKITLIKFNLIRVKNVKKLKLRIEQGNRENDIKSFS
jgi:hypothetical protein